MKKINIKKMAPNKIRELIRDAKENYKDFTVSSGNYKYDFVNGQAMKFDLEHGVQSIYTGGKWLVIASNSYSRGDSIIAREVLQNGNKN